MDQRRRLFASACAGHPSLQAQPQHMYTFHFWQHLLDMASLQLAMPLARINLAAHLDGQPLQLLACLRDGREVWAFDVWHEALLPAAGPHAKAAARGAAAGSEAPGKLTAPEP